MQKLVIGCGFLGHRVAALWLDQGNNVAALTRSAERADLLSQQGITPVIGDVTQTDTLQNLPDAQTVLYAVGFDRRANQSREAVTVLGLQNVLQHLESTESSQQHRQLIYISSISVYGQSDGEWVDENAPCKPVRENGQQALQAEQALEQFGQQNPHWNIWLLRLAGIYGPGRLLARLDGLKNGEPLQGNPAGYLNLIHVDDAARVVLACDAQPVQFDKLLVCDDQPVARQEFYGELAKQIGAPIPVFDESSASASRTRTVGMNKRCSNKKLRQGIGYAMQYPNYKAGLAHALEET